MGPAPSESFYFAKGGGWRHINATERVARSRKRSRGCTPPDWPRPQPRRPPSRQPRGQPRKDHEAPCPEARPDPWALVNCRRDRKVHNSRTLTARITKSLFLTNNNAGPSPDCNSLIISDAGFVWTDYPIQTSDALASPISPQNISNDDGSDHDLLAELDRLGSKRTRRMAQRQLAEAGTKIPQSQRADCAPGRPGLPWQAGRKPTSGMRS